MTLKSVRSCKKSWDSLEVPRICATCAVADIILVNKADGDNKLRAITARADYGQVLHYLRPATEGWCTGAYTCSSLAGGGIQ